MFTDSIDENVETLRELLAGVPAQHRNRAKKAAVALENTFTRLQADHPKDSVIALGAAFAIFKLAQRLVEAPKQGDSDKRLIQLLS